MSEGLGLKLIERAVELWCRELKRPQSESGDDSLQGAVTAAMRLARMDEALLAADIDSRIAGFRAELTRVMLARYEAGDMGWGYLSTDYRPQDDLAAAAELVGLPAVCFPIKSEVMVRSSYVTGRFGYGAADVNHYPLSCGGWLVTTLTGIESEMAQVIASVSNGNPIGLTVEPAQVTS